MKCLNRHLVVSFIYLVLLVLFFHGYFGSFSTALIGPPEDNMQELWAIWHSQTKLDTDLLGFLFTKDVYYPEGTSLIYYPFSYPNLAAMYIIRHVFGLGTDIHTLIFLYNFFQLISFYLGAMGAYLLTRLFVKNETLAVISGFIFGFSPFHLAHALHHLHVGTISFVPFFVYGFIRYMREKKLYLAILSVLLWVLSALSCWYYLVYIGYFVVFYYVFYAITQRAILWKDMLLPITVMAFFVLLLLSPLIIPMILVTSSRVYAEGHNYFVADLLGFITFHPYHLLSTLGAPVYSRFKGNGWEMIVYIGLVNAALLIIAFIRKYYMKIENLGFGMACILVFMILSCGSYLHIAGRMLYVPLPTLLTEYIPLIKHVRTPSRAVIFVYLFTGVSVAMIVEYLLINRKRSIAMATLCLLSLITFIDFYPSRLESTPVNCPPVYAWIDKNTSNDFGIINLPVSYLQNNKYMMLQAACSQKPIANGYIGRNLQDSLIDTLDMSDIAVQKNALKKAMIKYIVIHKHQADEGIYKEYRYGAKYKDYDMMMAEEIALTMIDEYKNYYKIIHEDEFTALFQVY